MTYNTDNVVVCLGDPFENPQEERFLNKLRRDLSTRGLRATIVGNFVTPRPNQRQVDYLVLTDNRLVHVEAKALDILAPLTGKANGPWEQRHPSGVVHRIEPNPYRQAHNGTYAIKDLAAQLIRSGKAAPVDGEFYRHIDTVVCIDPAIPAGSHLEPYTHVDAIGYDQLVERLARPGPRPSWKEEDWQELYRRLGVYPEHEGSPTAQRQRNAVAALDDYAYRFAEALAAGLHELVPVGFASGPASALDILAVLEAGGGLVLVGPSGTGKSHTARHLAVELSRRGALVLWLRADEYDKGRFRSLLFKAAGPYSAVAATELVAHAAVIDRRTVLVLDGINECREKLRPELVEQLNAFTLRYPASVLVTTTGPAPVPGLPTQVVTFQVPQRAERHAILVSYGAAPDRVSEAFSTAFELSVAAQCQASLGLDATQADLFDAYVRRFCPGEAERAGLRCLAASFDTSLRMSMRLGEATQLLGSRSDAGLGPSGVDAVLASPLLRAERGRVAFSHEQLGRFLAAEHLVLTTANARELVEALTEPGRLDLHSFALGLERDDNRRAEVLWALADPRLHLEALEGGYGPVAVEVSRGAIARMLADAALTITAENATFEPVEAFFGRWQMGTAWSLNEVALLKAAGLAVRHGWFTTEVGAVLDRTDGVMAAVVRTLRAEGAKSPISGVVAGAYGMFSGDDTTSLAASLIVNAELPRIGPLPRRQSAVPVDELLAGAGPASWGRLYLACLCADHRAPAHQAVLVDLLRSAWAAGGYHLRLQALAMATQNGRGLDPGTAEEMGSVLEKLETNHLLLQSSIVEALAACGRVVSDVSIADVAARIDIILSEPFNVDHQKLAAGLVGSMFEDPELVGPVCEVIDGLPPERRALLMAMAASQQSLMFRYWALDQVVEHLEVYEPSLDALRLVVLEAAAAPVVANGFQPQEDIALHVLGVRGLARLTRQVPEQPPAQTEREAAWELMDRIVAGMEGAAVDSERTWSELIDNHVAAAVEVLWELSWARVVEHGPDTHDQLTETYPVRVRRVLEWGLTHGSSLPEPPWHNPIINLRRYIVRALGGLGDQRTARLLSAFRHDAQLAECVAGAVKEIHSRQ